MAHAAKSLSSYCFDAAKACFATALLLLFGWLAFGIIGSAVAPDSPASAPIGVATPDAPAYKPGEDRRIVIGPRGGFASAWVDDAAFDRAMKALATRPVDRRLLRRLRACQVPAGTMVVIEGGSKSGVGVLVINGAADGCVGIMSSTDLRQPDARKD